MGDKAARWLRVSTGTQDEASQVPDVDRHISERGYEVTRTYNLHGKSASKGAQEPALRQAIADIQAGEVTVIVAWSLDRLDRRGVAESFRTKLRIEEAGGRVEFAREPTLSELEFAVKAYVAGEESKTRSNRVRMGLDAVRANGAATGPARWGYAITGPKRGKMFVPTASGRKWVPLIFQAVADGMSVTRAAAEFSGKSGKQWSAGTISALVRCPTYKGTVVDSSGTIVHRCEALVDAALWRRANDAISNPERKKLGPRQPKAMLAGTARCGECGSAMYLMHRERVAAAHYRCIAGHGLTVPAVKVHAAVDRVMRKTLAYIPVTEQRLVPGQNWDAEIEAAKFELRHLDLDSHDYDQRHAELRAQLADLKSRPSVPDEWQTVELGYSYGDVWADTKDDADKAGFLKKNGFTVKILRSSILVQRRDDELAVEADL